MSDATVCIWDRRCSSRYTSTSSYPSSSIESAQLGPALEFKNVLASSGNSGANAIWSLRFSRARRGFLGVLASTGQFRTYDIRKDFVDENERHGITESALRFDAPPEKIHLSRKKDLRKPFDHKTQGYPADERIVSFDWMAYDDADDNPKTITLELNGRVQITPIEPRPQRFTLTSRGSLVRALSDQSFCTINPTHDPEVSIAKQLTKLWDKTGVVEKLRGTSLSHVIGQGSSASPTGSRSKILTNSEAHEVLLSLEKVDGNQISINDALVLSTIERRRAEEGYMFRHGKNIHIVSEDPWLGDLWRWIGLAEAQAQDEGMIKDKIDFAFLGVNSIWHNDLGSNPSLRRRTNSLTRHQDISSAIRKLGKALEVPIGNGCETKFPEHRKLCLHTLGAAIPYSTLEEKVEELRIRHSPTKAAAVAIFHDEHALALKALRNSSPGPTLQLLAMAIVGSTSGGQADPEWQKTIEDISAASADPYARAILAWVKEKGDFRAILQEQSLPLKYRVEIAIRWLPDADLSSYLTTATARAVAAGDVEGIVLTGLTDRAVDLFENYITKSSDLQTSILAMSFTAFRFVRDPRLEAWRASYRSHLNSYKLYKQRVLFDRDSKRMAITWDGKETLQTPPRQIALSCTYCSRPIHKQSLQQQQQQLPTTDSDPGVHPTEGRNPLGVSGDGTYCPHCKRHLPRCGVCLLWLGQPDPTSRGAVAAQAMSKSPFSPDQAQQQQQRQHGSSQNGIAAPPASAEQQQGAVPKDRKTEAAVTKGFLTFCASCNHGHHYEHAAQWFAKHSVCPVASCHCVCYRDWHFAGGV